MSGAESSESPDRPEMLPTGYQIMMSEETAEELLEFALLYKRHYPLFLQRCMEDVEKIEKAPAAIEKLSSLAKINEMGNTSSNAALIREQALRSFSEGCYVAFFLARLHLDEPTQDKMAELARNRLPFSTSAHLQQAMAEDMKKEAENGYWQAQVFHTAVDRLIANANEHSLFERRTSKEQAEDVDPIYFQMGFGTVLNIAQEADKSIFIRSMQAMSETDLEVVLGWENPEPEEEL